MAENTLPLAGKRAVVTGATRGIGRSIALALAEAGADVAVCARSSSELTELAAHIHQLGRHAHPVPCAPPPAIRGPLSSTKLRPS